MSSRSGSNNATTVVENHEQQQPLDDALALALESGDCSVCAQALFSVGQRVVFLPNCHHFFHENCLNRRLRTRLRDENGRGGGSSCPQCHRGMGAGELVQPVHIADHVVLPGPGQYFTRSTAMAKMLVQKLLWSSIAVNSMHFLKLLDDEYLQAPLFRSRHGYIRESGMVPALLATLQSHHEEERIHIKVLDMLKRSLHTGNTQEAVDNILQVTGVGDVLLQSLSCPSQEATAITMGFLHTLWTFQGRGRDLPRNDHRPIHWLRVVEGVIAAMNRHSDSSVQGQGSRLLKAVSLDDTCVKHIVKGGGLLVLYAAQKEPQHSTDADECLQHILSLDLQLA